jgi:electron transport complex protein RnfG
MDNDGERNAMIARVLDIGLRLFAICAASAVSLAIVNAFTKPQIDINRLKLEQETIAQIVRSGVVGEKIEINDDRIEAKFDVYETEAKGAIAGYVLKIKGTGYGGEIKLLAYYKPTGELVAARLMENSETPGLGKKAEDPAYMNKFTGRGGSDDKPIPVTKQMLEAQVLAASSAGNSAAGTEVRHVNTGGPLESFAHWMFGSASGGSTDSVTGATITFSGVSAVLKAGSEYVKTFGGNDAETNESVNEVTDADADDTSGTRTLDSGPADAGASASGGASSSANAEAAAASAVNGIENGSTNADESGGAQ